MGSSGGDNLKASGNASGSSTEGPGAGGNTGSKRRASLSREAGQSLGEQASFS